MAVYILTNPLINKKKKESYLTEWNNSKNNKLAEIKYRKKLSWTG